jgi:hypothetical protein
MGSAVSQISKGLNSASKATGGLSNYFAPAGITGAMFPYNEAPSAPGVDPNLQSLKDKQSQNAQQFRQNIPGMEQTMGNQIKKRGQQNLGQNLNYTKSYNSGRGLLYGGINQGQMQGQRAASAQNVASGINTVNTGLENAANQLDAQAIETGVGIQQNQQAIQNQLYSQAMAQQNANNSLVGNIAATGLLLAM